MNLSPQSRRLRSEALEARLAPAQLTWTGAVDGNWNATDANGHTNWQGDVRPAAGDNLIFASSSNKVTVNDTAPDTAYASLTFIGGDYSVAGNTFAVGQGGITVQYGSGAGLGPVVVSAPVTLTDASTFGVDSVLLALVIDGPITLAAGGLKAGGVTFNGPIHGPGGLTGGMVLAGDNDFTGPVDVSGLVTVTSDHGLGAGDGTAATGTIVEKSGTLLLRGVHVGDEALAFVAPYPAGSPLGVEGDCSWDGPVTGGAAFAVPAGSSLTLDGKVSGDGLDLPGAGTVTLANLANDYTGQVKVAGTLRVGADGALSANGSVVVGGTLDLGTHSATVQSLDGTGTVTVGAGQTLTVGAGDASSEFRGTLAGSGTLRKVGGGDLLIIRDSAVGAAVVEGGALIVAGTLTGDVTLAGGLLRGSFGGGAVGAVSSSAAGGVLALSTGGDPHTGYGGYGALRTAGLTLNPSGRFVVVLETPTGAGAYDQLHVTGPVTLGGAHLSVRLAVGATRQLPGYAYRVIDNRGASPVVGTFAGLPESAAFAVNGEMFRISYRGGDGNDVVLTRVAVPATGRRVAVGSGPGGPARVTVFSADGSVRFQLLPYGPRFRGGVRVATADFNGDFVDDIVVAPGPGGGPYVEIYDGATGQLIRGFTAYDPKFTGGVYVAAADVDGGGVPDVVTGAGAGGGPHVEVFSGKDGHVIESFFAFTPKFHGGVTVAAGDLNGDGYAEVIAGAATGGNSAVAVFSNFADAAVHGFSAFGTAYAGGVTVAAADLDGDGKAEIIAGTAGGGPPRLRVFNGSDGSVRSQLTLDPSAYSGGVRVGAVDLNGDDRPDLLVAPGPSSRPRVQAFDGRTDAPLRTFWLSDPTFRGGVYVG